MSIVIVLFGIIFRRTMRCRDMPTPLMGWLVGLSFFLILPLCILILNGGYQMPVSYHVSGRLGNLDLSDSAYVFPFLVIWSSLMLTASTLLAVFSIRSTPTMAVPRYTISIPKLRAIIIVSSAAILASWVLAIIWLGGIQNYFLLHWNTRFQNVMKNWGSLLVLFQHATNALQILLTAATALLIGASLQKHTRTYGILIFALIMAVLDMIMTGDRIYIALLMLYVGNLLLLQRRLRLIFLLIMALPVLVLFFSAWAHVRGGLGNISSSIANYQYEREKQPDKLMDSLVDVTEGSNVIMLFNIIRDFGSRYDYLYGATYARAFAFFIPRSIYPDRTQPFTLTTAELYQPGVNTSISSTALGEMYANFGIFSVLLLPLFTLAILWVNNRIVAHLTRHALMSGVLFMLFAWMSRSVFAGNFITFILCAIIIWGLRFEKGLLYPADNGILSHASLR